VKERESLERRVDELEREVAALRGQGAGWGRGIRKGASRGIGNLPFYEIALGPDVARGERRGHAKAVIAIGDVATGVLALGGLSWGLVAAGGAAAGVLSFGGPSIGLLCAIGGLAIGSMAVGGGVVGGAAVGGGAAGYYACGGGAAGQHVVSALRTDPEALEFSRRHGVTGLCASPFSGGHRR